MKYYLRNAFASFFLTFHPVAPVPSTCDMTLSLLIADNNGKNNIGENNGLRNTGVDNGNDNIGSNNGNDNGGSGNGNGNRGNNNGNSNGQGNLPSGNRPPLPPVRLEVKQRPSTNKRLPTSKLVNPTTSKVSTRRSEGRPDESNDRPTTDIPDDFFTGPTTDLPEDYYRNRRYFDWRAYLRRLFRNLNRNENEGDYNYRNYRPWNYRYQPGSTRHWSSYT